MRLRLLPVVFVLLVSATFELRATVQTPAAAPDLKVLVTSRAVLHLAGEHELVVPPLEGPDPKHLPSLDRLTAADIMSRSVLTIPPMFAIEEAARLMVTRKISALPVTEDGHLVGIVTDSDVLHLFVRALGVTEPTSRIDVVLGVDAHALDTVVHAVTRVGAGWVGTWPLIIASIGGVIGIGVGVLLLWTGQIRRSFADYAEWEQQAIAEAERTPGPAASQGPAVGFVVLPASRASSSLSSNSKTDERWRDFALRHAEPPPSSRRARATLPRGKAHD